MLINNYAYINKKYVYNRVAGLVDRGRVFDIIYFACAKHLKLYSMTSLSKLERREFGGWTALWIRIWLHGHTRRVVVNDSMSNRVMSSVLQGLVLGLDCSTSLLATWTVGLGALSVC